MNFLKNVFSIASISYSSNNNVPLDFRVMKFLKKIVSHVRNYVSL